MKRVLAFLLILMLPLSALAEARKVTLGIKVDEAVFPMYFQDVIGSIACFPTEDADQIAGVVGALLKNAQLTTIAQEDAVSVEMSLGGGLLFDMIVRGYEDDSFLTSSLLPGYSLVMEIENPQEQFSLEEEMVRNALQSAQEAIVVWLADIEPTITHGVFHGDAYEGGTECTTWILGDQDLAALLSVIATDDVRLLIKEFLQSTSLDAEELLNAFDEANDRVADEDKFLYMLRIVKGDSDQFIGASLTIMEEFSQVASVSFGLTENTLKCVAGLGLDAKNYWWEYQIQINQRDQLVFLRGTSREWVAEKDATFAYTCATYAPVEALVWNCNVSSTGNRYLWDGNVCAGEVGDKSKEICSFNGSVNPSAADFETQINLKKGAQTAVTIDIGYSPCETIPPLDDSLIQCSLADPTQQTLFTELYQKFSLALTARLMKILPLDVILALGEIMLNK